MAEPLFKENYLYKFPLLMEGKFFIQVYKKMCFGDGLKLTSLCYASSLKISNGGLVTTERLLARPMITVRKQIDIKTKKR